VVDTVVQQLPAAVRHLSFTHPREGGERFAKCGRALIQLCHDVHYQVLIEEWAAGLTPRMLRSFLATIQRLRLPLPCRLTNALQRRSLQFNLPGTTRYRPRPKRRHSLQYTRNQCRALELFFGSSLMPFSTSGLWIEPLIDSQRRSNQSWLALTPRGRIDPFVVELREKIRKVQQHLQLCSESAKGSLE
jgi:hypothetical protein